ncbi:MAG: type III secretion system gatekeeper subunit SctW [Parachlamydiales bacterium]|jgi:type III secretion protein W
MTNINPSTPPPIGSPGQIGGSNLASAKSGNIPIQQVATIINLKQPVDDEMTGLFASARFRNIDELKKKTEEKGRIKGKGSAGEQLEEEQLNTIEEAGLIEDQAKDLAKKNDEFKVSDLIILYNSLKEEDTANEILKKVLGFYPDPTLADEALEFLGQIKRGALQNKIKEAQKKLNDTSKREVVAGKNIQAPVQAYAPKLSQPPSALRDLYREIIGKERTANQLFDDLFQHFPFEHLVFVFAFLFDALGTDLNAAGPSVPKAQLYKLVKDVKNMQAILGVYRYFKSCLRSIKNEFKKYALALPNNFEKFFENLSQAYLKLLDKKYLGPNDLMMLTSGLGLKSPNARKTILTAMREATRQTSLELYGNSNQRRQEVLNAFMKALETLEKPKKEEKA